MPEMQSPKLARSKPGPSTVRFLDIAEIRDDTVVLKDGTLRAVVLVSSINFALKSEDEQEAIISAYVSFLNSLEHPIEVVIQSRKLNIDAYMSTPLPTATEEYVPVTYQVWDRTVRLYLNGAQVAMGCGN